MKYDVAERLGVKCTARHCNIEVMKVFGHLNMNHPEGDSGPLHMIKE